MAESRFERWSRLKRESREEAVAEIDAPVDESLTEAQKELAVNEQLSDEEILAKYELPDPDLSELGMDIKGFLRSEIPEALRRRALRSLWRSNPVLAVLDGLNDYDEDFSKAFTGDTSVQTLYQVGKGMFDKVKRAEEKLAQLAAEETEIQIVETSVSNPVEVPQIYELASSVQPAGAALADAELEAEEPEYFEEQSIAPTLRYRPRMSFE